MDKCPCLMKQDLEESSEPYKLLAENYPIPSVLSELNKLSKNELKCACCLFGTLLLRMCQTSYIKDGGEKI